VHFPREFGTAGRRLATPVSTIDVTPTLLDFAGVDPGTVHAMDGKTWRSLAVEDDVGDQSLDGRCIFSEMDTSRALVCDRCHKLIDLRGGRTRSRGASLGYAVDNDLAYFNLCAEDGNYVDYPAASKESVNIAWANWDIFTALQDVMNCFMEKTSPQKQPDFDVDIDCSFADSLDQVRGQTGPPNMIPTTTPTSVPTTTSRPTMTGVCQDFQGSWTPNKGKQAEKELSCGVLKAKGCNNFGKKCPKSCDLCGRRLLDGSVGLDESVGAKPLKGSEGPDRLHGAN